MFPKSIMVVIEIYGKYIPWDWQKITPHDFFDTGVITGTTSIKSGQIAKDATKKLKLKPQTKRPNTFSITSFCVYS